MAEVTLSVRGVDTLLFRDGRPFTDAAGGRAETLPLAPPQTLAGFLRTRIGLAMGLADAADWARMASSVRVRGPLLRRNAEVILSAPADVIVPKPASSDAQIGPLVPLRPWSRDELAQTGAGTDLPVGMLPMKVPGDDKPASGFSFWRWSDAIRWLGDELPAGSDLTRWLEPEIEERVHIAVDPKTGASAEGMLFSTRMVAFESYRRDGGAGPALYSYLCRVDGVDDVRSVTGAGLLGGESRVAVVETEPPDSWPTCPTPLARMLAGARHVRMALATPAIFTYGWHPGWLDQKTKTGSPPGLPDVTLRLVAAAVPRRQAVSGWDLMQGGPKPIRYCVPAGAVYFFEVVGGDPAALAQAGWLASVSDAEETRMPGDTRSNNRDDGYGLALWGVWKGKE